MKKTIIICAAVLALAITTSCKSGATDENEIPEMCITPPGYFEEMEELMKNADTTDLDSVIFIACEEDAVFPGGEDSLYAFLERNIRYPKEAKEKKIEGKVYVTFVVERDGSITHAQVVRDIGAGCGAEAVRVVNRMPKWKPGEWRGHKVRLQYYLPVEFTETSTQSGSKCPPQKRNNRTRQNKKSHDILHIRK